jgi:hypothetical protein
MQDTIYTIRLVHIKWGRLVYEKIFRYVLR